MNIIPIVRTVAGLATSLGAGAVVGNAIKFTTPVNMKLTSKILVGIGGVTLSSLAGDMAANYIENQINVMTESWRVGKKVGENLGTGRPPFEGFDEDTDTGTAAN